MFVYKELDSRLLASCALGLNIKIGAALLSAAGAR